MRMAVLVQRIVPARYAFVIHTRNPSNNDEGEVRARWRACARGREGERRRCQHCARSPAVWAAPLTPESPFFLPPSSARQPH